MANEVDLGLRIFLADSLTGAMGGILSSISSFANQVTSLSAKADSLGMSVLSVVGQLGTAQQTFDDTAAAALALTTTYEALEAKQQSLKQALIDLDNQYQGAAMQSLPAYQNAHAQLNQELQDTEREMGNVQNQILNTMGELDQNAASVSNLSQGFNNLITNLDNTNNQLNSTKGALNALGVALGAGTDLFLFSSGLKTAVTDAASLQDSLVSVQISLNATDQTMQAVGQNITSIADNSVFSTKQVADGFVMLAQRGYDAQQIMGGLGQSAINLAEAVSSDTVPAADLLANTMRLYNADASQSAYYTNALVYAFNNGIPSVSQLSSSIAQVAGVIEQANVPITQLIPTLDYLARNGLPNATQAATDLRYMIAGLITPTAQGIQELSNLGVVAVGQATPAFLQFEAALRKSNKTAAETVSNYSGTVVGLQQMYTEAKRVGLLTTDQTFMQWAQSLGMVKTSLFDAKGNVKDLYSIIKILGDSIAKLPTQQAKLQAIKDIFGVQGGEGAQILLSNIQKVLPQLQNLTQGMQNFQKSNGAMKDAADRTNTLNGSMAKLQTTFGSFMAGVGSQFNGPLTGIVNNLNNFFSLLSGGGPKVQQFGAVFLGVGAVLAGVTLVVALLAAASMALNIALLPIIGIALGVAVAIAAIAAIAALIVVNWGNITKFFGNVFSAIGTAVHNFFTMLGNWIKGALNIWKVLQTVWAMQLNMIGNVFKTVWNAIIAALNWVGNLFKSIFNGIVNVLKWFYDHNYYVKDFVDGVVFGFNMMKTLLAQWWNFMLGLFQNAGSALKTAFDHITRGIHDDLVVPFQNALSLINNAVNNGLNLVKNGFNAFNTWVLSWAPGVIKTIGNGFSNFGGFMHDHIIKPLGQITNDLIQSGKNFMQFLANGIAAGAGWVWDQIKNVAAGIWKNLGFHSPTEEGILSESDQWMPNMMKMYSRGIEDHIPLLQRTMGKVGNVLMPQNYMSNGVSAIQSQTTQLAQMQGSNSTVNFQVDGKPFAQAVINNVTGQLVMNGAGRLLR